MSLESKYLAKLPVSRHGILLIVSIIVLNLAEIGVFAVSFFSVQDELLRVNQTKQSISFAEDVFNRSARDLLSAETRANSTASINNSKFLLEHGTTLLLQENCEEAVSLDHAACLLLQSIAKSPGGNSHQRADYAASISPRFDELERLTRATKARISEMDRQLASHCADARLLILLLFSLGTAGIILPMLNAFAKHFSGRISYVLDRANLLSEGKALTLPFDTADEFSAIDNLLYETSAIRNDSKRKARAILDNSVDVICTLNGELNFIEISRSSKAAWGYSSEELLGAPLSRLLSADSFDQLGESFKQAAAGRSEKFESTLICKNGLQRIFLWSCKWLADSQRFYCNAHDVSDLRAVQKFRQDFLNMISHDMRAPLSSAKISLSMLESGRFGNLPNSVLNGIAQADNEIEKINELVQSMLELQRCEIVEPNWDKTCVSVFEICSAAIAAYAKSHGQTTLRFTAVEGDGAVYVDEEKSERAFYHLICALAEHCGTQAEISVRIIKDRNRVCSILKNELSSSDIQIVQNFGELSTLRLKIAGLLFDGQQCSFKLLDNELSIEMPEFIDDDEDATE